MNNRLNIVLRSTPNDAKVFDRLEEVSRRGLAAGLGDLQFVRDGFIDSESARYEFRFANSPVDLWLHDDFALDLRYLSLAGPPEAVATAREIVESVLETQSLDEILAQCESEAATRPALLNALAIASPRPAPPPVVAIVKRFLRQSDENVVLHAVQAALLIGETQFRDELTGLAESSESALVRRFLAEAKSLGV